MPTLTFDQAIDQLVAQGYPQRIEADLNGFGTSPLGMRMGGTTANNAAAQYIADEMQTLGMVNVRLEKAPVDVWEWYGASATVQGRKMTATSFGGVPPTPAEELTGELVYVGLGSAQEFDAAGDVSGKIPVVDFAPHHWSMNLPGLEAKVRGCKAVVLTLDPMLAHSYEIAPDALGTRDGCYSWDACPMVYVCQNDGDWLKSQVAAGPTEATVVNDLSMRFADQGGFGYNVVGEFPGSSRSGEKVIYGSHHDAYFHAGLDDASGVVANLMMVKAMKMSGFKPHRTIILVETTSEEWGYTDAYYDWLAGSYQLMKAHPEWPGKVAGWVGNELLGYKDGSLWMTATPEFKPFLEATAHANRAIVGPTGGEVFPPDGSVWFTNNDQWCATARGIPSVCLWTVKDRFWSNIYHTNYDTADLLDWKFLGDNTKFIYRIALALDKGLLPYSLDPRANHLAGTVNEAELASAGIAPVATARIAAAVADFRRAASAYDARRASISYERVAAVNAELLDIEVDINTALTGLGCWDETWYPHQQALYDTQNLSKAISQLEQPNPVAAKVLVTLSCIGITRIGQHFSEAVWERELERHEAHYGRLNWAQWGNVPAFIDIMSQWREVNAGEFSLARDGLVHIRDAEVTDLKTRLTAMAEALESVTPRIAAVK